MKKMIMVMFTVAMALLVWSPGSACSMMGDGGHEEHAMSGHQGSHGTTEQQATHAPTGGFHQGNTAITGHDDHGRQPAASEPGAQQVDQQRQLKVLNQDQARSVVQDYLISSSHQHLMILNMSEGTDYYEAKIVDHGGTLVDRIRVDKQSGTFQSAYASE